MPLVSHILLKFQNRFSPVLQLKLKVHSDLKLLNAMRFFFSLVFKYLKLFPIREIIKQLSCYISNSLCYHNTHFCFFCLFDQFHLWLFPLFYNFYLNLIYSNSYLIAPKYWQNDNYSNHHTGYYRSLMSQYNTKPSKKRQLLLSLLFLI